MRIVLDLSSKDLAYFRSALKRVREGKRGSDERLVITNARQLLEDAEAAEPPDFVRQRFARLAELIDMLEDEQWRLTGPDRARVLNALAYFVDPDDLIPDRVPGLGYLDDAIMVELVVQDLRHELEAVDWSGVEDELRSSLEEIAGSFEDVARSTGSEAEEAYREVEPEVERLLRELEEAGTEQAEAIRERLEEILEDVRRD